MDFTDKMRELQSHIRSQNAYVQTEEATKNALILPFLELLGYATNDAREVVPEYCAAFCEKKDSRVDYAILKDNNPIILIECKKYGCDLRDGIAQIKEYYASIVSHFESDEPVFVILTDGNIYEFYTDLGKKNVLDNEPFLELNILKINDPEKDASVTELKKFCKPSDIYSAYIEARQLKYMRDIKAILKEQFINPSDGFVKFFANEVYGGNKNKPIMDLFKELTKKTLNQYITDSINDFIAAARDHVPSDGAVIAIHSHEQEVETTKEELEVYYIIKTLLKDIVDPDEIIANNSGNSFDIIHDGMSRKTLCRLYLSNEPKYIGLFDENDKESRSTIESIDDIYGYADQITARIPNDQEWSKGELIQYLNSASRYQRLFLGALVEANKDLVTKKTVTFLMKSLSQNPP